ncbi:MAG: rod shape-determining protein MreC [Melioribacteraceae bacterium]|jgi:rod shape-determining protein MreC|nr:rod shape-determining protein MreC [Melioribacteraceae bacterium]
MLKIFLKLIELFKANIVFTILLSVSFFMLAQNNDESASHIKAYTLGVYAVVNEYTTSFINLFKPDKSLEELKRENASLMLEVNRLRSLESENEDLRSKLGYLDTTSIKLITAKIVSKLVTKVQGNFIVNRGLNDGVQKGMPVITEKGLVGIIDVVDNNYSIVKNLLNTSLNIAVSIKRLNIDGILNYDGNHLIIKNIPTTYDIKTGDIVETSVLSTAFPPKIPVGFVSKKESNMYGLLHNLTVNSYEDVNAVSNIFIVMEVPSKTINNLELNFSK